MLNKIIFSLVGVGIAGALFSAYVYAVPNRPLPPVFNPASNPYAQGIYAEGIVESYQSQGANINQYPEVSGTVSRVLVAEGQVVHPRKERRWSRSTTRFSGPPPSNRSRRPTPRALCSRSSRPNRERRTWRWRRRRSRWPRRA